MYLGNMLSEAKIRRIFIEIIREAVLLADKMDAKIEIFGGKLEFKKFIRGSNRYSDLKRHLMIRINRLD
jgi:2-dehydropantoate 2-reductase